MLGVTSVDRCRACARVHERWGTAVGLDVGDPLGFLPGEGRSDRAAVARLQTTMASAWALIAGGCRLDHDVRGAIGAAGFRIAQQRLRGDGVLVEVVATLG